MEACLIFPRLYAIADRETLDARGIEVTAFAEELREGGVRLLQYRDKQSGPQEVLRSATRIAEVFEGCDATLILNDRSDLAGLLGWGCHVGQGDLPVAAVRKVLHRPDAVVGLSTHNVEQIEQSDKSASYLAIGPVFPTSTKLNPDPVVGLEGVRRARSLTNKPLVAIGGITLENVQSVMDAGADSVAVIGGLLQSGRSVQSIVEDFLERLDR